MRLLPLLRLGTCLADAAPPPSNTIFDSIALTPETESRGGGGESNRFKMSDVPVFSTSEPIIGISILSSAAGETGRGTSTSMSHVSVVEFFTENKDRQNKDRQRVNP
jgi:hypothetical protein